MMALATSAEESTSPTPTSSASVWTLTTSVSWLPSQRSLTSGRRRWMASTRVILMDIAPRPDGSCIDQNGRGEDMIANGRRPYDPTALTQRERTMRKLLPLIILSCCPVAAEAGTKPPVYLWLEPEWFEGVQGHFAYWTGTAKPNGAWGVAGPGISAEWSQGGESEWNSMGAPAEETKARCQRDLIIPRAGKYHVWVRYVDHRHKTEPFRVILEQGGKPAVNGELGVQ